MPYTHQKRPYLAHAIQWDGNNFEDVAALLPNSEVYRGCLMIRHESGIWCMSHGDWAVKGMNGQVKVYSDEVFRVKYEELR